MCFTDISTLWTCQGVSEGVHDNPGCSITDPRKPHRLNLKLAREEAYISPEPPALFTEGTPQRALIRKVFSFCGYCRSYRQGASWDEQKDRVCACSHIPFHSLSLQEASAYVKILALISQSSFEAGNSASEFRYNIEPLAASRFQPSLARVPLTLSPLSTETWHFPCFPRQMMDRGWAKYGDRVTDTFCSR